jgi:hypothetical protein
MSMRESIVREHFGADMSCVEVSCHRYKPERKERQKYEKPDDRKEKEGHKD